MRAGDTVFHKPSGEKWTLAYHIGEYVAWCGWPAGEAFAKDCVLIKEATDDEHRSALEEWAKVYKRGDTDAWDRRPRVCFDQLCLLNQAFVGMHI